MEGAKLPVKQCGALVIGGGFAGLSAAVHLAAAGLEVTLLERHNHLGGKAGEHRWEGYRFDTGPSVLTLPSVFEMTFATAGRHFPVELVPLELLCRYSFPSGRVWDVYQDVGKTIAQLSSSDARAYQELLAVAERMHEASAPTFLYDESPSLGRLVRFGLRHGRTTFPRKKLPQLLDYFGAGPELKQFFLRFATYFGADPFRAPAILHNIAWAELGMGVYYPVGGVAALVGALTDLALELGVEIRTAEPVTRIVHRGGRVEAVSTEQAIYRADAVISALDIVTTYQLLGIPSHLTSRELSLSGFILLLALRGGAEVVRHHSVSFSSAYEAEFQDIREGRLPRDPTLYLNVSARTDPSDAPQGGENWFVMANAPARGDSSNTQQAGDEAAYADHLLAVLEHRGFEVRSAIAHSCYLGPRHLSRFGHKGSIYGVAPHSLTSAIRPKQTIAGLDGLVLAGGTVHPGGGVPLAVLSGRHAAATSLRGLGHPGSL